MVICMKTTLNLSDELVRRLKLEAARRGTTMTRLMETALRLLLDKRDVEEDLPELPTLEAGRPMADVSDREELYRVMNGP